MAKIKRRGHLIAGVNAAFLGFGYLNPFTGLIEGFEIDLARQLAKAIFGNPDDFGSRLSPCPSGSRPSRTAMSTSSSTRDDHVRAQ